MNDIRQALVGITLCTLVAGCANIPGAESPMEMQKSFAASFEDLWSHSVRTVKALEGTTLAEDKPAGLIVCKIPYGAEGSDEYVNIYVRRENADKPVCCVYVVPYTFSVNRGYIQRAEAEGSKKMLLFEFDDISFRKDHLSEVGNAFLDKLTDNIGQARL
jgi:hypothetical protein